MTASRDPRLSRFRFRSDATPAPDHAVGVDPNRPQPVLDAAKLGGLVSAAVVGIGGAVFAILAGVTADNIGAVGASIGVGVSAVVALGVYLMSVFQGRKASQAVTPLEDPRDDRGVPLVPVDRAG